MIGGLREKAFAAYRVGIREVILPRENMRDVEDIPKEIRDKMTFHPVDAFAGGLKLAILEGEA